MFGFNVLLLQVGAWISCAWVDLLLLLASFVDGKIKA